MEFLIAGLLVVDLAVTLVCARLLKRELRRQLRGMQEQNAEATQALAAVDGSLKELLQKEADFPHDEEARRSRDIETGLANILGYTAGKGAEAGT